MERSLLEVREFFDPANLSRVNPEIKKNGLYLGLCLKPSKELLPHKFTATVCGVSQH